MGHGCVPVKFNVQKQTVGIFDPHARVCQLLVKVFVNSEGHIWLMSLCVQYGMPLLYSNLLLLRDAPDEQNPMGLHWPAQSPVATVCLESWKCGS